MSETNLEEKIKAFRRMHNPYAINDHLKTCGLTDTRAYALKIEYEKFYNRMIKAIEENYFSKKK